MSTALRSAVPASLSTTRLTGIARHLGTHLGAGVRTASSLHVGAAALTTLVGGLLLAIATTSDPLWWQLHFSQLGTFGDLSSAFFNTTLKVSGAIVVFFAFCVRRDVRRLGRGPVRRGAATVAFVCLNVVGVNLALVGCIPLNTDKDLHDRVAGSMVLGFLALLITAPIMFNRLGKRMAIGTAIATVWLVISIALFVTATINLALFETIACAAMFAWSGMFTQVLAGGSRATSAAPRAQARHLATRRVRRPLVAARPGSAPSPTGLRSAGSASSPAGRRRSTDRATAGGRTIAGRTISGRAIAGRAIPGRTIVGRTTTPSTSAPRPNASLDTRPSAIAAPAAPSGGALPRQCAARLTPGTSTTRTAPLIPLEAGPVAPQTVHAPAARARRAAARVRAIPAPRTRPASAPVSASRAVPAGSAGARRAPSARPARHCEPPVARGVARSLLR